MPDEGVIELNVAGVQMMGRMIDAIKGMKLSITSFMQASGQGWSDWVAADLVDQLLAEIGADEEND